MTESDRDLVSAVRTELAAIDPARPCDRRAEAAGLGDRLSTREASVARLAVRLGRDAGGRDRLIADRGGAKHFRVTVEPANSATPRRVTPSFAWADAADHCRAAYLRGLFLARGSLSLASGRSHLEFVLAPDEAPILARQLEDLGLPAGWRVRRGRGVVTWKSTDTVGTFLGYLGARSSLLELESRRVARSVRGELNRVLNAESANLQRAVLASSRQLAAIADLESDGRLARQSEVVRAVAAARRETPEANLGELAARLDLHRSAVQRSLERIERLALHPPAGQSALA